MRIKADYRLRHRICGLTAVLLTVLIFVSSCSRVSGSKAEAKSDLDYSKTKLWAYFNDDGGSAKQADCFIISPTVYVANGRNRNLNVKDPSVKRIFISGVSDQKAVYSENCAIYSPFYSQASIEVYSMDEAEAAKHFDIAYADVENAFLYYMKNCNHGRPLVLSGFSQGADMCIRLLKDHGNDPAVKKALVACYAIGWRLTDDDISNYPHLKPAQGESDTGVIICYDCESESVKSSLVIPAGMKSRSINPLNWKTDSTPADKTMNNGSVMLDGQTEKNLVGCYIDPVRGALKVTGLNEDEFAPGPSCFRKGELHIYDIRLFSQNLKENVAVRLKSF